MLFGSHSTAACPIDPPSRQWIDYRMGWLIHEFGLERLRNAQAVLPRHEFFPDPFDHRPEDARAMLDRVCGYMGVDPASVELAFYEEQPPMAPRQSGTAGIYEPVAGGFRIWIEASGLDDPLSLAATMAHELGHVLLLGQGRVSTEAEDHEPLTDLATVFLGMGVITANAVIREKSWQQGGYAIWRMGRGGYLDMPTLGYALALFARLRDEVHPPWSKELRADVRAAFRQSAKFLAETMGPDALGALRSASQANIAGQCPFIPERHDDSPGQLVEEGKTICRFCGVEMVEASSDAEPSSPLAVCRGCQQSIDVNSQEFLEHQQQVENGDQVLSAAAKWGCAIWVLAMAAMWLGYELLAIFSDRP